MIIYKTLNYETTKNINSIVIYEDKKFNNIFSNI